MLFHHPRKKKNLPFFVRKNRYGEPNRKHPRTLCPFFFSSLRFPRTGRLRLHFLRRSDSIHTLIPPPASKKTIALPATFSFYLPQQAKRPFPSLPFLPFPPQNPISTYTSSVGPQTQTQTVSEALDIAISISISISPLNKPKERGQESGFVIIFRLGLGLGEVLDRGNVIVSECGCEYEDSVLLL